VSLLVAVPAAARADAGVPIVDAHTHIIRSLQRRGGDVNQSAAAALK
jgi:hypothetical protein